MNRRQFLEVVVTTAAAATVPCLISAGELVAYVPDGEEVVGMIREIVGYDVLYDVYRIRHDAWDGETQLSCMQEFRTAVWRNDENEYRSLARASLANEMCVRGIRWTDLKPLPMPTMDIEHCTYI